MLSCKNFATLLDLRLIHGKRYVTVDLESFNFKFTIS